MVVAESARTRPLYHGLPADIVIWEIFVRLPPKSVLRCRAVCRSWRRATSTREFLLAHHSRQLGLPIAAISEYGATDILAFDHRAASSAQLHNVAMLDRVFYLAASCDGLLVMARYDFPGTCFSICNPVTRQYAPIGRTYHLKVLGMYLHRLTGEYRLLLYRWSNKRLMCADLLPQGQIGCYVFGLGSDHPLQPPRYIGWPEKGSEVRFETPALVRDSLHWISDTEKKLLIVFDTITESFRQMHAPTVPVESTIFEMDGTLGIYTSNIYDSQTIDIWVLQNYKSQIWGLKYRIKLPVAEIMGRFEGHENHWDVKVVSGHDDVLLLVSFGWWLLHIDSEGKLVASFRKGSRGVCFSKYLLKQTLVSHTLFMALEGHVVNPSPFK